MRATILPLLLLYLPLFSQPFQKDYDQPNPIEILRRREALERQAAAKQAGISAIPYLKAGIDKVLIILVEFGGTDTFEFTPGKSTWDPYGIVDSSEWTGKSGDCSNIVKAHGLTGPKRFTYKGPLHNRIERPLNRADRSGEMIWSEDFSRSYYESIAFGDGVQYSYERQDGSAAEVNLAGKSVRNYYLDASGGRYSIEGDVLGWVQVPHSIWWYGADPCPGRRSAPTGSVSQSNGAIPGAGNARSLVIDAIEAAKTANPNFDWAQYDRDHDGVIDRLWIIYAGLGEEDAPTLLGRTDYGEGGLWSHSSAIRPAYEVKPGLRAGPYIMMTENSGVSVLAHEFGHNLGAADLYAYQGGETSAGFWTVMADDWTGFPIGGYPSMFDPLHLDEWGWLEPEVISDPGKEHIVKSGQASGFSSVAGSGAVRAARIELPDGERAMKAQPNGARYFWSGSRGNNTSKLSQLYPVLLIAGTSPRLSLNLAYNTESLYDYLFVQASNDSGRTWVTLTNTHTTCTHGDDWTGEVNGFPADMCAAKIGGFTGTSREYPKLVPETFDLSALTGGQVMIRFFYLTDGSVNLDGAFIDDIQILDGASVLFADDLESADLRWSLTAPWERSNGVRKFAQHYYLQWRNTSETGGFDRAVGDPEFRYGSVSGGLLVWYNNEFYSDNEVANHLYDVPSFGPKGRMLVVDAHPEPYRDPALVAKGYESEAANLTSRMAPRDAAFSLLDSPSFTYFDNFYEGRAAVSSFSDAKGYWAGAEHVSRGPGYDPPAWKWVTKQWDASVVTPSTKSYALLAPGYGPDDELRYRCSANPNVGTMSCTYTGANIGLGVTGGTGNPGDVDGHYGWNIAIVEQTAETALVRVWNDKAHDLPPFAWIRTPAPGSTVSGDVAIDVAASDDVGLDCAELYIDGRPMGVESVKPPYRFSWDTSAAPNGVREIVIRVKDTAGQIREDRHVVTLRNTGAPMVYLRNIKGGAEVSGVFRVESELSNYTGGAAAALEFFVDDVKAGDFAGDSPNFAFDWDTSAYEPGYHRIRVRAVTPDGKSADCALTVRVVRE
jgi:immune inhibitor A